MSRQAVSTQGEEASMGDAGTGRVECPRGGDVEDGAWRVRAAEVGERGGGLETAGEKSILGEGTPARA